MPTSGQVDPQRSGGETQPGATSPYALFSFSLASGASASDRGHICRFISGKGWYQHHWYQSRTRRARRVLWYHGHPFALESRGLAGTTVWNGVAPGYQASSAARHEGGTTEFPPRRGRGHAVVIAHETAQAEAQRRPLGIASEPPLRRRRRRCCSDPRQGAKLRSWSLLLPHRTRPCRGQDAAERIP